MTDFWVERRKWPDTPHYAHEGRVLGEDQHGLWIELAVGNAVYRGEEIIFYGLGGGLMLAPPTEQWLAWFPEFGRYELYVDIVIGLTRTGSVLTMIDLDLDIVRLRTGEVLLVDEDEFDRHQIELAYPPDVVGHARREAAKVLDRVNAGREPFDGAAAASWLKRSQETT